jgi:hypothetical protein
MRVSLSINLATPRRAADHTGNIQHKENRNQQRDLPFRGIMKRIPAFILLVALSFEWSIPAKAQIFSGPDRARQAQKAAKKQQKAQNKAAKKQQKSMKKYEKARRMSYSTSSSCLPDAYCSGI